MEQAQNSPSGTRRSEDIALDLLKFVSSVAGVGRATAPSTGFTAASAPKPEDQITQLLELYSRCLRAVEGKVLTGALASVDLLSGRKLRVAVVGAGAFGRNHLRVYRELEQAAYPVTLTAVIDSNPTLAAGSAAEWQIPAYTSVEDFAAAAPSVDAVSVCVPTSGHFSVASVLLRKGIDLLIEKPIAASIAEADGLIGAAESLGRILQIGHLERFNPAVAAIYPYLNGPMFFEAHRLSVFTPRALDVDVVLDLMIHDLDIVLKLANSPVSEVRAVGLPILSRKVDIANVRLEFESGCVANFTASRVSTELVRKLRFFQPHQYVSIDYARRDLLIIDVAPDGKPSPGLNFTKPPIQPGEPLRLEIEAFLDSVRTRKTPQVTGHDGRDALAVALRINAVIAEHASRAGLAPYFL